MKIYGISGLGADRRVFDFLNLDLEFIPIDWIEPKPSESIQDYSFRLSKFIDTGSDFGILGVSFGGLVAIEISKTLNPRFTILISSVATKTEIPSLYRLVGKSGFLKHIPENLFNPPRWLAHYLFGAKNTDLLDQILDDTDLRFTKWAINELVHWNNQHSIQNLNRIHGTNDKLLTWKGKGDVKLVKNGGHLMIVDKAEEVSRFINEVIKNEEKNLY